MNQLVRVAAPGEPVISLDVARAHLRVDAIGSPPAHPEDALIQLYTQAAIDDLDGVDGWLGRALVTQTWKLILDAFPAGMIRLPLPPLQSVSSVKYLGTDGVQATLPGDQYRVVVAADPGYIEPVFNGQWPQTRRQSGAIEIEYVAGYGDAAAVPGIIRSNLLLRIGLLYQYREPIVDGRTIAEVPWLRDSLENVRMRGVLT